MAPNRRRRPPPPPVENLSSDSSSSGEEEEVETSSSEDEQSQPQINTQMTTPKKPQPPTQPLDSDSESESGSESESDSDDEQDKSVKPSTSKTMKETTTTPKKAAAIAAAAEKSTAVKGADGSDQKRVKNKKSEPENKDSKKPLFSSSGEDEDETSSGEGSDDEQVKTQNSTPKKPQPATQQSESDSESESGSESESESEAKPDPITSKSKETESKEAAAAAKKSGSKPAVAAALDKSTAINRGNGTDSDSRDVKRAKIKESEPEEPKKSLFERLWTEKDEVALLRDMIDFIGVNGGFEPRNDMNALFNIVKKSIHFDPTLPQFSDKIRRLRKKFENSVKGEKGEGKTFKKAYDQKVFDLSKRLWGNEGCLKASGGKNYNLNDRKRATAKKPESSRAGLGMNVGDEGQMEVEMDRNLSAKKVLKFDSNISFGNLSHMCDYAEMNWARFASETKKAEMEEKERKIEVAAMELAVMRNELKQEKAKLVVKGLKAGRR